MTTFERAFGMLLEHEGGFSCEREDPGNWTGGSVGSGVLKGTKFGISAAAYPGLDIAGITEATARSIYQRDYWERVQGDALPPPLALLVFDAAVNNGVGQAVCWLQIAAGTVMDGKIGPQTLAAVAGCVAARGPIPLCTEFLARRMMFMASLPDWRVFGLGWARRLAELPFQAVQISATAGEPGAR